MKLSSGPLYSIATYPNPPSYPRLEEDIRCEVLIVGAGEAGAQLSYFLAREGIDTVVVDKRSVASGTSSSSTGMLQFQNDTLLYDYIRTLGEQKGVAFYRLCRNAIHTISGIVPTLEPNPDFQAKESLWFASSPGDAEKVKKEYDTLIKYDFPVRYWPKETVERHYSFSSPAAIYSSGNAEINPYKYAHALIAWARRKGARVFEHTEVKTFEHNGAHPIVKTDTGRTITAQKVVFATGYETQQFKRNRNVTISSSYVIVTQPLSPDFPGWFERSLIWETAKPYLFMRTTPDHRIVCGGMDENTDNSEQRGRRLANKKEELLQAVCSKFPQYGKLQAEYYWGSSFASTDDGLPLIGEQDGYPDCYFALGYGGSGTIYSVIAAEIITSLIVKGSHPDAELFAFDRA